MKKSFCDQCGVELHAMNQAAVDLEGDHKKLMFSVMFGLKGKEEFGEGDWCKYCVIDAVDSLDDRPRCAQA